LFDHPRVTGKSFADGSASTIMVAREPTHDPRRAVFARKQPAEQDVAAESSALSAFGHAACMKGDQPT
jgi:hypothetical protein